MTDYEKQATDFLEKYGITFKAIFKGDKCPPWDDNKHIHGDRYWIILKRTTKTGTLSLSFWNSLHDKENNEVPNVYDVLASITKYDPEDFKNFCSSYGYEEDSIRAYKIYRCVKKEWDKINKFFTDDEIEELQEIN